MEGIEVQLPGGVAIGGQWCRSAWLRPVSGREEEFLLNDGRQLPAAARVTQLIARCLQRLGPLEPVGAEWVRLLTVGDREALLLQLRRLTMGERLSCLLECPHCSERMDLDLTIDELLLLPYPHAGKMHEAEIAGNGCTYRVTFRLPNGADQEAAVERAARSIGEAEEFVLRRCIEQVDGGSTERLEDLPAAVLRQLPAKMAALDPQAELLLNLVCPACGAAFAAAFDPADYLWRELAIEERAFYREVHSLSLHYHWSEEAVLRLTRRKRRIYLDLLTEEVAGGGYLA